ncbi:MAG: hypothetical protein SNH88_02955 [Rikenellaceae bacterium]
MILFKFRMLSDENDHFLREFEIASSATLLELHHFITEILEYEEAITSFFTADDMWERLTEYTVVDMGDAAAQPMASTALSDALKRVHDRLIYMFDIFENRAYYLELVEVSAAEKETKYPREIFAHATPPDQYDANANIEDGSIFDEMMDGFSDFDESDGYDDEY